MKRLTIDFFFYLGRATAACISREKPEALSRAAGRGGGINSPTVERKRCRSRKGHAEKCGVGGTRRAAYRGGTGLAGEGKDTGGNSCVVTSAAAAGDNE